MFSFFECLIVQSRSFTFYCSKHARDHNVIQVMTFSHKIRPLQNTETNPVKKQEKKTIYFVIHSRSACYIFQSRFISRFVTYMVSLILNRLTFSLLFANLVWITAQSCGRRLEGCSIVTCKKSELRKRQQRTGAFEFVFYVHRQMY